MLYISYGSVCELEPQILSAWDLDFIEKGELSTIKKDIAANRKNVKSTDKIFRKQTLEALTPGILGPSSPTKLEKNLLY
jgi:hypothetical protein